MEKQKIKILVVGDFFYAEELFSVNLLDLEKIELLNAVDLEGAIDVFNKNEGIDLIIFLQSAFESFESLADSENNGFKPLENEIGEKQEEDFSEEYVDLATEAINKYIDEHPDLIVFEGAKFDENKVKNILPKFIKFVRSLGFSGEILISTDIPDIASKFLKAGCSGSITSIYKVKKSIDTMYLQKNSPLV